jgi:hypothetical protein
MKPQLYGRAGHGGPNMQMTALKAQVAGAGSYTLQWQLYHATICAACLKPLQAVTALHLKWQMPAATDLASTGLQLQRHMLEHMLSQPTLLYSHTDPVEPRSWYPQG